jgi:small subunit ribosomal protein S3
MGQKTSPVGNRLGIIRGWESNWFGGKDTAAKVVEDEKIRNYLKARIRHLAPVLSSEKAVKKLTVSAKN